MISGSFAERDLQHKVLSASLPLWTTPHTPDDSNTSSPVRMSHLAYTLHIFNIRRVMTHLHGWWGVDFSACWCVRMAAVCVRESRDVCEWHVTWNQEWQLYEFQSHVEQLLTAVWVRCHVTCMNDMSHGTRNVGSIRLSLNRSIP